MTCTISIIGNINDFGCTDIIKYYRYYCRIVTNIKGD